MTSPTDATHSTLPNFNTSGSDATHSTLPNSNPSGSDVVAQIRAKTEELMAFIEANVPSNRQRSIALTNYVQASMWAVEANFV